MVFNAPYLENELGDPLFFAFLAIIDLYLTAFQVLKKCVRDNILGANVH